MIKIAGYYGVRDRTRHNYEQMTYAELKSKSSKVADEVLKSYYDQNPRKKVHLCGSCDFFSYASNAVRDHVARRHPPTTRVYKIIELTMSKSVELGSDGQQSEECHHQVECPCRQQVHSQADGWPRRQ